MYVCVGDVATQKSKHKIQRFVIVFCYYLFNLTWLCQPKTAPPTIINIAYIVTISYSDGLLPPYTNVYDTIFPSYSQGKHLARMLRRCPKMS